MLSEFVITHTYCYWKFIHFSVRHILHLSFQLPLQNISFKLPFHTSTSDLQSGDWYQKLTPKKTKSSLLVMVERTPPPSYLLIAIWLGAVFPVGSNNLWSFFCWMRVVCKKVFDAKKRGRSPQQHQHPHFWEFIYSPHNFLININIHNSEKLYFPHIMQQYIKNMFSAKKHETEHNKKIHLHSIVLCIWKPS